MTNHRADTQINYLQLSLTLVYNNECWRVGTKAPQLNFEWDDEKAKANLKKHGVSFDEATTVFIDPFSMRNYDPDHSVDEQRYIDIGNSDDGHVLVVAYTERGANIRLISCRKATPSERKLYEKSK